MSKVVLITGASSGIGFAIANYLTYKGFIVYGTSRNPSDITPFSFKMIPLEVTNIDSINTAIATIIDAEGKLDVLVNNAGIGITGPLEDTPTTEMRKVFDTNFFGVVDVMKAVLPHMRNQKYGLIINITSIAGYMGLPYRGVYSAIKGGLELLTEAVRMEVKNFGVKVVNIAPGDFSTNIVSGRYHTPIFDDSPYKESYGHNLDLMNEHVKFGKDPIEMAKKIHRIIVSKNPKTHYRIGSFLEKSSITLKRILPDKIYERLLMNYYKM